MLNKKYAVLYDKEYYIKNLDFDEKSAAAYRVRLWEEGKKLPVGEVPPGSRLEILEHREGQYHVRATDGTEQQGWIREIQVERVEE